MGSIIRVNHVEYAYPGSRQVLQNISFSINKGEFLLICGGNGSGKSTIGYLLNGLIPHFFGGTFSGSVDIFGMDTRKMNLSELFCRVGLVVQNADAQLFTSSVEDEMAFGLESLGLAGEHIQRRIDNISKLLQIDHLLKRSPERLSGGEKRMAGIASILCLKPSIVILDEPYANLDQTSIKRVRSCLKNLHESGLTLVVIEQRMNESLEDASRCLVVEQGKVVYNGHPGYAKNILISNGLIPQYPKRTRKNYPTENNVSVEQIPVLTATHLCCSINGKKILKDISFNIFKGQVVSFLGKNGAGKTTLLKHLNGLYRPTKGKITIEGQCLTGKNPSHIARLVGLSFQNPNDQFFKSRVDEELQAGLLATQKPFNGWLKQLCNLFQLNQLLHRSPFKLSEGEKKRVAIASFLAIKPEILILDEPTAGQDGRAKQTIASIIEKLARSGLAIIIATHDMEFAHAVSDRWIVLDQGTIAQNRSTSFLPADMPT